MVQLEFHYFTSVDETSGFVTKVIVSQIHSTLARFHIVI